MTKRNSNLKAKVKQGRPAISSEKFIEKAVAKHGLKYNYDNVRYVNNKTKIDIGCEVHGIFSQEPSSHLKGAGCPVCAKAITAKKVTKEQFIAAAEAIHGKGRYDYSKVEYKGNKVKVTIGCNECGSLFYMRPNNHVSSKSGCRDCQYIGATLSKSDFIRRSEKAHGVGRYDYTDTVYIKSSLDVEIYCNRCKKHFKQKANAHMSGSGCIACYHQERRLTQAEFLERCYAKHGYSSFDYSNAVYYDSQTPIEIKCNTCGTKFEQPAASHLATFICCPNCLGDHKGFNRESFKSRCIVNNGGIGKLYVIKACDNGVVFFKVGITSHSRLAVRFKGWGAMPYIYQVVFEIEGDPDYIYDIETQMHRLLRGSHYTPSMVFGGAHTECFTTIKPVEKLLKQLQSTDQLQLIA